MNGKKTNYVQCTHDVYFYPGQTPNKTTVPGPRQIFTKNKVYTLIPSYAHPRTVDDEGDGHDISTFLLDQFFEWVEKDSADPSAAYDRAMSIL